MENIAEILDKAKVLVVGDVMMDTYIMGDTKRVSPEAPVPVVNIKKHFFGLGGAGNVLNNLISLNIKCSILTLKFEMAQKGLMLSPNI